MNKCEYCGKTFTGRKGKRYCSTTCRVYAFQKRQTGEAVKTLQVEKETLQVEKAVVIQKNKTLSEVLKTLFQDNKTFEGRLWLKCNKCGFDFSMAADDEWEEHFCYCLDCGSDNVTVTKIDYKPDKYSEYCKQCRAEFGSCQLEPK